MYFIMYFVFKCTLNMNLLIVSYKCESCYYVYIVIIYLAAYVSHKHVSKYMYLTQECVWLSARYSSA